jgi:hypothetical protein
MKRGFTMSDIVQRTYPRISIETPIQYAALNSNEFHPTRSLNFSAGGLCYQSDQPLEPMAEVCIVMLNYSPERYGPEGYRSYLARIRWVQPSNALQGFATGAQIIARSHDILTADINEPQHICDLCGALMAADRLISTEANAQLCQHCYRQFLSVPEGKIRQSVERFLVGNVH